MLEFPNNVYGLALNLERDSVGAVILGDYTGVSEGDQVKTTGRILEVPGPRTARPRGQHAGRADRRQGPGQRQGHRHHRKSGAWRYRPPLGVATAADRHQGYRLDGPDRPRPARTIIGDRQTGKTAVAVDTIISQKGKGVCVYVAIGQKASTINNVVRKLEEHGALEYTIVVAASASDSAAMQYLAAYAGCTMGEYSAIAAKTP